MMLFCRDHEERMNFCGVGVRGTIVSGLFFDLFGFSER